FPLDQQSPDRTFPLVRHPGTIAPCRPRNTTRARDGRETRDVRARARRPVLASTPSLISKRGSTTARSTLGLGPFAAGWLATSLAALVLFACSSPKSGGFGTSDDASDGADDASGGGSGSSSSATGSGSSGASGSSGSSGGRSSGSSGTTSADGGLSPNERVNSGIPFSDAGVPYCSTSAPCDLTTNTCCVST